MGERPCTVRKYASTLKTSAILVASLAGLWLGIIGQLSASTESVQVVTARPSAEDCGTGDDNVVSRWNKIIIKYESILPTENIDYTLGEFKTDMNDLLTSPELINCQDLNGTTVAIYAAYWASVEGAEWAVSKGADLSIKGGDQWSTPYEWALLRLSMVPSWISSPATPEWAHKRFNSESAKKKWIENFTQVAKIFAPPPAEATKSCAEVDGQTPLPANEYCIVAENLQSSIETEVSQSLKRLIGVDYRYNTDKSLSGTALYPGWKATITFTCALGIQDCGPAYVPGDRWSDNFLNLVKKTFGLSVKCGDSGNLLDVDSIEPGESVSITHSSDTERSSPWYRNCEAMSGGPFTLSIKTTRLAQ